ncbi:hypothetical protein CEP48_07575 [Mergibacter septicus]|uniref:Uncharacterized protein n=1 Tax=Mergibacter septicus TaxID=221402 RepID=A0A8D4J127_9PAST|nr:hypothetical protein [Mergibacter septicus]AWX16037.1 hypothetical protein CEP47_07575 [Mergibacter septicus]QDJ15290.1 hypothetical protein CEP48_07575 [Mergibacter septicus]UTU47293.1 hypothetical protein HLL31_00005 [Mergibacter septicus]WMR95529.1 hypothetical protein RDJ12_06145 [Mergibacter septicus]
MKKFIITLFASLILAGCVTSGEDLGADVYDATQLNTKQETRTVRILSIIKAKVAVDNKEQKQAVQTFGAILSGVTGAVIGYQSSDAGAVAGAIAGTAAGALGTALVKDKVIVEGVSLTYREGNKVYTSTQAGKRCQFKEGIALVITTKKNETRIQPNAECPSPKSK